MLVGGHRREAASSFRRGSDRLAPEQDQALAAVAADLAALQETAARLDVRWRLRILGHASPEGSDAVNQRIARRRAEAVRQVLMSGKVCPPSRSGLWGWERSPRLRKLQADEAQRRNVTFEVVTEE